MRRHACAIALVIGCGAPPRAPALPELATPTEVAPTASPAEVSMFAERTSMLRATLARNNIALDDGQAIETCNLPDTGHRCVKCDVATGMDGIDPELVDRVAIAIAGYPSIFLYAAKIERFTLCKKMRYVGEDEGPAGLAQLEAHRALVSVEAFADERADFNIEQVVHHELFHLFDHAMLGEMMKSDMEWYALKPPDFEYRDPAIDKERRPGFVNVYATTSEMEDRASVYEHLMAHGDQLCELVATDRLVHEKAKVVWDRVARTTGAGFLRKHAACFETASKQKPKPPPKKAKPGKPDLRLHR